MRCCLIFHLIGLVCVSEVFAARDSLWLRGRLVSENQQSIIGVNVFVQGREREAVSSNVDGRFALLVRDPHPTDRVVFAYPFDGGLSASFSVAELQRQTEPIVLRKKNEVLQEVVVGGKRPIAYPFTRMALEPMDIYAIPLAQGDPLRAIAALPYGTNTDESANVSLRGSSPDRSVVILNGTPIHRPVRNSAVNGMGTFSLFDAQIVGREYIYPSAPPLTYGNSSAGLVEIETKHKLDQSQHSLSISLANVGFFTSEQIRRKQFVQLYGNAQFGDLLLPLHRASLGWLRTFYNQNLGGNWHAELSPRLSVNVFAYGIRESMQADIPFANHVGLQKADGRRFFSVVNLRYSVAGIQLSVNGRTDLNRNIYSYGNVYRDLRTQNHYISAQLRHTWRNNHLQAGFTHELPIYTAHDTIPVMYAYRPEDPSQPRQLSLRNPIYEYYAFDRYEFLPEKFMLSVGVRKNWPASGQPSYTSAQVLVKYVFEKYHSVNTHYGYYNNFADPGLYAQTYRLLRARQANIDYEYKKENYRLSVSVFYKKEFGREGDESFAVNAQNMYGVEVGTNIPIRKRLVWNLSYSYLRQRLLIGQNQYKGVNDFPYFVRTFLSYNSRLWGSASLSYVCRPGVYYTPIQLFTDPETHQMFAHFSDQINSIRLNSYQNLSVQYTYVLGLNRKPANFIFFVNLTNVLNRKHQVHPYYSGDFSRLISYFHLPQFVFYTGVIANLYR